LKKKNKNKKYSPGNMKENPQVFKKKSSKNKNSTGLLSITTLQKTVLILSDQNGSSLLGQKIPHEEVSGLQTPV
jgi:hypothetical protein